MTLKEWIDNPNLKAIPGYHLVKDQLNIRYKKMVKDGKKFKIAVYQHPSNGLLVLVRVPTEGDTPDLTYDVLFHVTGGVQGSILNNNIKVFSNCPSFTYRYAFVCHKLGLLIPEYTKLYDKEVIEKEPKITNPMQIVGYEKSILFALWSLHDNGYRTYVDLNDDVLRNREDLKGIMTAEAKKQQAQILKRKYQANKPKTARVIDMGTGSTVGRREVPKSKSMSSSNHRVVGKGKMTGSSAKGKITGKKKIK